MSDMKRYNSQEAYVYDVQRYPMATAIPDPTEWVRFADAEAAIKAAVEEEREACAVLAGETVCDVHLPTGIKIYGQVAARAIRARGEEPEHDPAR